MTVNVCMFCFAFDYIGMVKDIKRLSQVGNTGYLVNLLPGEKKIKEKDSEDVKTKF